MNLYTKFKDILELIVFKHSVFALPFLFSSILVALKLGKSEFLSGFDLIKLLILGIIAAVSARSYAMAVNRLMDEDIDKDNPRTATRPNIQGRIGRGFVLGFIIANALIFVISCYFINALALKMSPLVLFVLAFYSAFKRFSAAAHLVLGLCLAFAPVAGSVIILEEIYFYSVILGLGVAFWTAGFDLLYALQDLEYDKKNGLHSIPAKFGALKTLQISAFFHFLAFLFWLYFAYLAKLGFIGLCGVFVSGVILLFEHKIVRANFSKIDRAFFTLNGYLSVLFFVFILIDFWWYYEIF